MHNLNKYELRDPVHKRIEFDEFEKTIIDHPFVQRLRHIRQVGLSSFVYPGANHTRFIHVLGSMYLAGLLFDNIYKNSPKVWQQFGEENIIYFRKILRLGGLLHDIGHAPFSHGLEILMPPFTELPITKSWWRKPNDERQAEHEDYSVLLIQTMAEEGVLEKSMAQDISSLIHEGVKPSKSFVARFEDKQFATATHKVLKSLISGEIDCDRMDYLLHDSYFAGVAYGQYDVDWLLSNLGVAQKPTGIIFTISENGVRSFEDFLLARYHMFSQVYFHKTKVNFHHYLEQVIENKEIDIEVPSDPYKYADLREGKLTELMYWAAKNKKNYWSYHLVNRIPAKLVVQLQDKSPEDQAIFQKLEEYFTKHKIKWFKRSLRQVLAKEMGDHDGGESPLYVVRKRFGVEEYIPIAEYSDLLKNYNQRIDVTNVYVQREDYEKFKQDMYELVSCPLS